MTASGASSATVCVVLESRATSLAAVRADAELARRSGADGVLLAATACAAPATLPFELEDFAQDRDDAPVLHAVAEAVATVRDAGLAVAVTAARAETLAALRDDLPRASTGDAGLHAIHVPSGALTDLSWLVRVAETGIPLWLGTGMSTQAEVDEAVAALVTARSRLTLVHALETGSARPDELNLRAISTLRDRLALPAGFRAGHAPGAACIAAVACGASLVIVEASDGDSLTSLVRDIRWAAEALGDGVKRPQASEWALRDRRQHSLVTRVAIPRGEAIGADMLATAPPGLGLKPRALPAIVGRRAAADIPAGTLLTLGMLE
jgi:NeuB family protein/SAF domain-containing protein